MATNITPEDMQRGAAAAAQAREEGGRQAVLEALTVAQSMEVEGVRLWSLPPMSYAAIQAARPFFGPEPGGEDLPYEWLCALVYAMAEPRRAYLLLKGPDGAAGYAEAMFAWVYENCGVDAAKFSRIAGHGVGIMMMLGALNPQEPKSPKEGLTAQGQRNEASTGGATQG